MNQPKRFIYLPVGVAALTCGCVVAVPGPEPVDPGPDPYAYDLCGSDDDCPVGTDCWDITVDYGDAIVSDSFCSAECQSDAECPDGGACQSAVFGTPLCYQRCAFDDECVDGSACVDVVGEHHFDPVCLPW